MKETIKKDIYNRLFNVMSKYYFEKGFELEYSTATYSKEHFKVFFGATYETPTDLFFNPVFYIINESITSILKILFKDFEDDLIIHKLAGCHLAREFGINDYDYLEDQKRKIDPGITYKVGLETDLEKIVEEHTFYMERVGWLFFEKTASLKGINEYLNNRIIKYSEIEFQSQENQTIFKRFYDKRHILSGTTAAYLVSEPNIDKLLNRYGKIFKGNDYILKDLEKVVKYFNNPS